MEILSQMWSLLDLFALLPNLLPLPVAAVLRSLLDFLTPYAALQIPEFNGYCGVDVNDLYRQVTLYLNSVNATAAGGVNFTLARSGSSNRISCSVAPNQTVHDCFNGHHVSWTHQVETPPDSVQENRSFVLKLPKRRRQAILSPYIEHVTARAEEFERVSCERRLFTNNGYGSWSAVPFRHPLTFETLALEPEVKSQIIDDLTAFGEGKEFYRKIGRPWKRGYLLYGPPGSGKSSLIAAMANYLRYDVYDLELSKVADNSELRALLRQTTNRSIVVIEDIDCTIDLTSDRLYPPPEPVTKSLGGDETREENRRVTLSGLFNFTDGLWSCCCEGRVMVFTTNEYDVVVSALVRCGRMDVHISLGTCGAHALRTLVRNYLGLDSHVLFDAAEMCLMSGGALTPAEIGEILLRNRRDADVAVKAVVSAMQSKILRPNAAEELMRESPEKCCGNNNKCREREVSF